MIDSVRKTVLGGFPQKVHILAEDPANPILLVLHGGPGMANRHSLMTRHRDLARDFILVAWDQRGCAGSYAGIDPSTLTVDRLVEDARELVDWLCAEYGQAKANILGGSWGTQLGTLLAYRYPERIAAYVGTGQVVNGIENERLSWEFCFTEAKKAGDEKSLAILRRIGPPERGQYRGGLNGLKAERDILARYGGWSMQRETYFQALVRPVLFSGEYTASDIWGYLRGYRLVLERMWPLLCDYDFIRDAHRFAMPYYIFQGRHDMNTPSSLVKEFFAVIDAPVKELLWFQDSAHGPMTDEPDTFKQALRDRLII